MNEKSAEQLVQAVASIASSFDRLVSALVSLIDEGLEEIRRNKK